MELYKKASELIDRKIRYEYYYNSLKNDLANEHLKPYSQRFLFTTEQEWQRNIDNWQHKLNKTNVKINFIKSLI